MTLLTLTLPSEATRPRPANESAIPLHDADWHPVCALDDIDPDTGVCALVLGTQVAVVRVGQGDVVFALGNFDPFSQAFVLSRGIVGDRDGVAKIASPLYKQSFDLRTGRCLDDASVSVPTWPARVRDGRVEIQMQAPLDPT
ncbi:MAG TPA: nitrite reductase small subunit NirD [Polyangia bacterium]|jgi:nitrite reductase (NADH) small subunit|nr:nitrite reductase small subunit NirD [Polyangia bacterium]